MDQARPAYRPTKVEDSQQYVPLQGTIRVKRVHYVLADGHQSYVDIPMDDYTAEKVQAALDTEAERHFSVMDIQGPMLTPPTSS